MVKKGKVVAVLWGVVVIIALAGGGMWAALFNHDAPAKNSQPVKLTKKAPRYYCPMHPTVTSDHPGDCPICGMHLVLDKSDHDNSTDFLPAHESTSPAVTIDSNVQQKIGLRTQAVSPGTIVEKWRTTGRIQVDPTRVRRINIKSDGYVEKIFVNYLSQPVRRGQKLFSFFSPTLLQAQNEYLLALQTRNQLRQNAALRENGENLLAAARRKLELLDVSDKEFSYLDQFHQAKRDIDVLSPVSGIVTTKNIVEGSRLNAGDMPYEITDLSVVWVIADVYENEVGKITPGAKAQLTLKAYPNKNYSGRVQFIEPILEAQTRTAKLHLHFANPQGELKPEMFGEVTIFGQKHSGLMVPLDAVIHTGAKDIVIVSLGAGKFEPRPVLTGLRSDEQIEIRSGLKEAEQVVTRANFLVDSESQLRSALTALDGK